MKTKKIDALELKRRLQILAETKLALMTAEEQITYLEKQYGKKSSPQKPRLRSAR